MRYRYVRFHETVASPGYAGSDISVARVRDSLEGASFPREQQMESIEEDGLWLVISAKRIDPKTKKERVYQRYTPITNVRDADPLDVVQPLEPEPPKPKGPAK